MCVYVSFSFAVSGQSSLWKKKQLRVSLNSLRSKAYKPKVALYGLVGLM